MSIKTGFIDPDSGFGILVSVQMVIVAALGGAGTLFGPLVGALILIPLQTATNTLVRRRRLRADLHSLWRHHRLDRALRAGRPVRSVASRSAETAEARSCCLRPTMSRRRSAASSRSRAPISPWKRARSSA